MHRSPRLFACPVQNPVAHGTTRITMDAVVSPASAVIAASPGPTAVTCPVTSIRHTSGRLLGPCTDTAGLLVASWYRSISPIASARTDGTMVGAVCPEGIVGL